jgi:hypothetical protein
MQFALWGSALYAELATGLWRALAVPWLEPGWPASTRASDRSRAQERRAAAAAGPADCEPTSAQAERVDEARSEAGSSEHRVIEVPRTRWQGRRAAGGIAPNEP